MNWLGIDTTDRTCSVALIEGQSVKTQLYVSDGKEKNTEVLLGGLAQICSDVTWLKNIDIIAVTDGPGSFSGVRVGCVFAQAIALVSGAKIAPVSSCAAWAKVGLLQNPDAHIAYVAMDARMGQVYWAKYQRVGDGVKPLVDDQLVDKDAIGLDDFRAESRESVLVGSMWANDPMWLEELRKQQNVVFVDLPISADAVIALAKTFDHQGIDAEQLRAKYLRQPV